ncbi:MAG: LysR substrate-binding domain-containing protein [Breoghania sp.]|nr:LysR substrate-binding domain-containing protein [Breoghania sp.]MDJ0929819.1 LysR substrate-binding domain-containing protein [Breoghania sp.]
MKEESTSRWAPPESFRKSRELVRGIDLAHFPIQLAVSSQHLLAGVQSVHPKELKHETFIGLSGEEENAGMFVTRNSLGFEPVRKLQARNPMTMLGLVEANLDVAVVSAALQRAAPEGTVFIELEGVNAGFDLHLFMRKGETEPVVLDFIKEAEIQ